MAASLRHGHVRARHFQPHPMGWTHLAYGGVCVGGAWRDGRRCLGSGQRILRRADRRLHHATDGCPAGISRHLLAIGVVALLGPGIENVIYAIAVFSVPVFARLVRGSTLALKQTMYVQAAHSIGVRAPMLMLRHILPGTLPSVIVYCSLRVGTSILTAAALSFIGLGAPPPSPEWGTMLAEGRSYLGVADQITLFPGIAIFITVLAFNLLGDGLRDALDQKLR